MAQSRYEELQQITKKYGDETWSFHKMVKDIGPMILEAYISYLGGPKTAAVAVPPSDGFDPRICYRGEAFDCYGNGTLFLEPIRMGVCTEIGNLLDSGATWVRTILVFHPSSGGLRLTVGNRERRFQVAAHSKSVSSEICEAIFQDAREAFSLELDEAQGRSTIGFIT
ncbi:hypothetical protein [uncultured Pseudophaeobacter sp.]|jgi:hypothetical protein|uniref:hypothetical protein n=1 Tax=uncultured Pseudophaeobacter sp. TaxID=1759421 RepID=UPI0025E2C94C|nr:hypothetical protein [uncultured Pseudophaeobacter sp.]